MLWQAHKKTGEIYIDSLIASEMGVPIACVTGDDKAINEALSLMPWVKTYITKISYGRNNACVTPPPLAREQIKKMAKSLKDFQNDYKLLQVPKEIEIRIEYQSTSDVDDLNITENSRRVDGRTVVKYGNNIWETYKK